MYYFNAYICCVVTVWRHSNLKKLDNPTRIKNAKPLLNCGVLLFK